MVDHHNIVSEECSFHSKGGQSTTRDVHRSAASKYIYYSVYEGEYDYDEGVVYTWWRIADALDSMNSIYYNTDTAPCVEDANVSKWVRFDENTSSYVYGGVSLRCTSQPPPPPLPAPPLDELQDCNCSGGFGYDSYTYDTDCLLTLDENNCPKENKTLTTLDHCGSSYASWCYVASSPCRKPYSGDNIASFLVFFEDRWSVYNESTYYSQHGSALNYVNTLRSPLKTWFYCRPSE